mgnify:CR=1 FL=1
MSDVNEFSVDVCVCVDYYPITIIHLRQKGLGIVIVK